MPVDTKNRPPNHRHHQRRGVGSFVVAEKDQTAAEGLSDALKEFCYSYLFFVTIKMLLHLYPCKEKCLGNKLTSARDVAPNKGRHNKFKYQLTFSLSGIPRFISKISSFNRNSWYYLLWTCLILAYHWKVHLYCFTFRNVKSSFCSDREWKRIQWSRKSKSILHRIKRKWIVFGGFGSIFGCVPSAEQRFQ